MLKKASKGALVIEHGSPEGLTVFEASELLLNELTNLDDHAGAR